METPIFDKSVYYELFDDFFILDTTKWTSVDDGGTGTNTTNAIAGGEMSVVTAGSDNDYHFMKSVAANFLFAANKPLYFEARFSLTEANTSAANFLMGLSSVVDNTALGADGGGPAANYSGALIFKVDGTQYIQFESSNATTQVTNATLAAFTSAVVYRVGFNFDPGNGTIGYLQPWVYNETTGVLTNSSKSSQDLKQPITLAALAQMSAIFGVKAGSSSAETLKIDYIRYLAQR